MPDGPQIRMAQGRKFRKAVGMKGEGPILRIFEVKTKKGCADALLENFATTSADVVKGHPGNMGYIFGDMVEGAEDTVMFVSVWTDLNAVKARFGDDWRVSYMPEGYEDLIDSCSVRHLVAAGGWHVGLV